MSIIILVLRFDIEVVLQWHSSVEVSPMVSLFSDVEQAHVHTKFSRSTVETNSSAESSARLHYIYLAKSVVSFS